MHSSTSRTFSLIPIDNPTVPLTRVSCLHKPQKDLVSDGASMRQCSLQWSPVTGDGQYYKALAQTFLTVIALTGVSKCG